MSGELGCEACGAPMVEADAGRLHGRIRALCTYCKAERWLPAEASARLLELRVRLTDLQRLRQAEEAQLAAIEQASAVVGRPVAWLAALGGIAWMAWPLRALRGADLLRAALPSMLGTALLVGAAAGTVAAMAYHRRIARPALLALAPVTDDAPYGCRRCGAALPRAVTGAFVTCAYCATQSLLPRTAADRRAILLRREVSTRAEALRRRRARLEEGRAPVRAFYLVGSIVAAASFVLTGLVLLVFVKGSP